MDPPHPARRAALTSHGEPRGAQPPPPRGRRPLLARPLFWAALVGLLFLVPLWKSLQRPLPDRPPVLDAGPLDVTLPALGGGEVSLSDLRGHLLVVTELPLANLPARDAAFSELQAVRKRLRGMASAVAYVVLAHGAPLDELAAWLDGQSARRPLVVWLLDDGHAEIDRLRRRAGSPSSRWLLVDRHGRLRGAWADDEAGRDALVTTVGVLANWPAADAPPEG